ncbi:hypothetical protein Q3G72_013526 [Acer saccharum]|nr:hypothetical protein Q3G72_013526 [Acer saccharum]
MSIPVPTPMATPKATRSLLTMTISLPGMPISSKSTRIPSLFSFCCFTYDLGSYSGLHFDILPIVEHCFLFRILGYYNGHPLLWDKIVVALPMFALILLRFGFPAFPVPLLLLRYGFGASFVTLFCAELVRKVEQVIPEYDPRNRVVIVDLATPPEIGIMYRQPYPTVDIEVWTPKCVWSSNESGSDLRSLESATDVVEKSTLPKYPSGSGGSNLDRPSTGMYNFVAKSSARPHALHVHCHI